MAKLLLADDSVTIQRVIEMTFAAEDITVTAVSDGEQAMARIALDRPDIILADIAMPKRNGYEVAAFVKSRPDLASIPVLLLAGAFEPVDQQRAEQVRCDGVLVKPFEPQQVIARVRELIAGAHGTPAAATSGVPRPVERLTAPLKLVEARRERSSEPAPAQASPPAPPAPHVAAAADADAAVPASPNVRLPSASIACSTTTSIVWTRRLPACLPTT
jgi:CheY-like chemotaxis protein